MKVNLSLRSLTLVNNHLPQLILAVIITSILSSCQNQKRAAFQTVTSKLNIQSDKLKNYDYVLIIPGEGCTSCIEKAYSFVKEFDHTKENYLFILTNYRSEKRLKFILGESLLDDKDIVLDKENVAHNGGFYSMYPTLIETKENRFKLSNLDPYSSSIWDDLEKFNMLK